jgi:hypothetical protein
MHTHSAEAVDRWGEVPRAALWRPVFVLILRLHVG